MDIEVGKRLKEVRAYLSLSQKDFAKKYGISQQALSKYENGQFDISDGIKKGLANEFDINIHWLLTGKGIMFYKENEAGNGNNSREEAETLLSYKEMLPVLSEIADFTIEEKEQLIKCIIKIKENKKGTIK